MHVILEEVWNDGRHIAEVELDESVWQKYGSTTLSRVERIVWSTLAYHDTHKPTT